MQDGKPHRLSYMAQVVKIVIALKEIAKKVSVLFQVLFYNYNYSFLPKLGFENLSFSIENQTKHH